jgi:Tol biopolymer transport system component
MRPSDQMIPPPKRSIDELLDVGRSHVRTIRRRRMVQTGIAVGLAIALAAVAIPALFKATTIGDAQNIAPIQQPDRSTQPIDAKGDSSAPGRETGGSISAGDPQRRARTGAGGIRLAPLPERVVFASFRDDSDGSSIYTMKPNGVDVRRLTTGAPSDTKPATSPDGARIAFTSGAYRPADGPHDIWIVQRDGSGLARFTKTPEHETDPAWSPTGDRLLVSRRGTASGATSDLYVIDVETKRTTRLTNTDQIDEWGATWSPDGTRVAFQRIDWHEDNYEYGIYTIKIDGTGLRRLTSGDDFEPAWSPDGKRIAFARRANAGGTAPGGINTTPADSASLYVMNADGSALRRVTNDSTVIDYAPDWSPDGDDLVFTRDPDGSEGAYATFEWATGQSGGPLSQICVVAADGSDLRALTDPMSGDAYANW